MLCFKKYASNSVDHFSIKHVKLLEIQMVSSSAALALCEGRFCQFSRNGFV